MRSSPSLGPSAAHDYDEPARPAWTFQQRTPVQAEKAEADDLPDDQPVFFIAPPLSVTRSELDFLVNQLDAVIAELQDGLLTVRKAA